MLDLVTAPTVISIDPGGMTGWSIMVVHPESLSDPKVSILANIEHREHGQIGCGDPLTDEGERKCVAALLSIIANWDGACVVIEDFHLRKMAKNRELLSPVRLTAMLEWELHGTGAVTVLRQQPSIAMTTATDVRLKDWGLYQRAGGQGHARDADRHSITHLRRCKASGALRGASWPHLYSVAGKLK